MTQLRLPISVERGSNKLVDADGLPIGIMRTPDLARMIVIVANIGAGVLNGDAPSEPPPTFINTTSTKG